MRHFSIIVTVAAAASCAPEERIDESGFSLTISVEAGASVPVPSSLVLDISSEGLARQTLGHLCEEPAPGAEFASFTYQEIGCLSATPISAWLVPLDELPENCDEFAGQPHQVKEPQGPEYSPGWPHAEIVAGEDVSCREGASSVTLVLED